MLKSKPIRQREPGKNPGLPYLLPALLLLAWFLTTHFQLLPPYLLPKPTDTLRALVRFAAPGATGPYGGTLWVHLWHSLGRVCRGFGLAAGAGLLLGYLCGRRQGLNRIISPFVHLIRSVPGIGWLPLAIVWFGVGEKNTLFLISLASFFPIFTNTVHSAASVSQQIILAGQMLGAKKTALFTSVILPASFAGVAVGLRLGLGIAWAYLVLGEMTGVNYGLGAVMTDARMLGNTAMVIVCIVVIAIAAKITDSLLLLGCRLAAPIEQEKAGGNS